MHPIVGIFMAMIASHYLEEGLVCLTRNELAADLISVGVLMTAMAIIVSTIGAQNKPDQPEPSPEQSKAVKKAHIVDIDSSYGHPMTLARILKTIQEQGLNPVKDAEQIIVEIGVFPDQEHLSTPDKPVSLKTEDVETYIRLRRAKK